MHPRSPVPLQTLSHTLSHTLSQTLSQTPSHTLFQTLPDPLADLSQTFSQIQISLSSISLHPWSPGITLSIFL